MSFYRLLKLSLVSVSVLLIAVSSYAGSDDYDVQVELSTLNGGIYVGPIAPSLQLSVKRKRQDIAWSLDEGKLKSALLETSQTLHSSGKLAPGIKPWSDGKGFSFQVAGLAVLVSWDGTVYLKHEGRPVTSSISLETHGKVVLMDGSFQEKLRIRSDSLEFSRNLVLEDFDWDRSQGKAGQGQLTIGKDSSIELRKFKVEGSIKNYGTIKMMDHAKVGGGSFWNYGSIIGSGTIDFYYCRNLSSISSKSSFSFDNFSFRNDGKITVDEKIEIKALSIENYKGIIKSKDLVLFKGALSNNGHLEASNRLELSGVSVVNYPEALLSGDQAVFINASWKVDNQGQMISKGLIEAKSEHLTNVGKSSLISAGKKISIETRSELTNAGQILSGGGDIQVKAQSIKFGKDALMSAETNILLEASEDVTNEGIVQSKKSCSITAHTLSNAKGALVSSLIVGLSGVEWVNFGTIQALSRLNAFVDSVKNRGLISNPAPELGTLYFHPKNGSLQLDNSEGQIFGSDIILYASKFLNSKGIIKARNQVILQGSDLDNKEGIIEAPSIAVTPHRSLVVGALTASKR